ncbi:NAD(P)H-binding protein [Spirillospora sp. CA-294931]|uniref:NAD(P)H-binding protein n=1 Tax=Spirillospora sp. CA-294931 TaxID=3240042 RepID=UPI003D8A81EE
MILVTGATGNAGRRVAARLAEAGHAVRALVRDPGTAALPEGAELAAGNLLDPGSLDKAAKGADAVFLVWPILGSGGLAELLDVLARHAGRVVYLSSSGVDDAAERQGDPISGFHAGNERVIQESGLEWTFLRADAFASNALGWAGQIRSSDVVRGPVGGPRAVIHEDDIAAVAARVLTEEGHAGARHVLTGPEVIDRAAQVAAIGAAIGRPLRFEGVSESDARAHMLADGRPADLVDALIGALRTRPVPVSPVVTELTGAPPRSFRQWAAEHTGAFR